MDIISRTDPDFAQPNAQDLVDVGFSKEVFMASVFCTPIVGNYYNSCRRLLQFLEHRANPFALLFLDELLSSDSQSQRRTSLQVNFNK
jgi:hypothetical protein